MKKGIVYIVALSLFIGLTIVPLMDPIQAAVLY